MGLNAMNRGTRTAVGLATTVLIAGCGSNAREIGAVRAVTMEWLSAQRHGDGARFCSLLGPKILQEELRTARSLGPHVTCAQLSSAHPPGLSRIDLRNLAQSRRQSTAGVRVDSISVGGSRATVRYSWMVPKHPNPILSFRKPAHGDRVEDTVTLEKLNGRWRIG